MKVKTPISEYSVKWEYDGNKTTCKITEGYSDLLNIICKGETVKNIKDAPNKDIARKISLSRALQIANLPKIIRSYFWETYRTMTKTSRW